MSTIGRATIEVGADATGFAGETRKQVLPGLAAVGNAIRDSLTLAFDVGMGAAATATAAVVGQTIAGGFNRAMNIDQAQAQLRALGHDGEDLEGIMQNALASVEGTAFGLGDAAKLAGVLVASGIQPGQELEGVLTTLANTASVAGTSLDEMGSIMQGAAARGRITGNEIALLTNRGVPALQILADHFGVTAEEAEAMVRDGSVSFSEFTEAMDGAMGDAALIMGQSASAMFANVRNALSRIGEKVIQPFIDAFKVIAPELMTVIDAVGKALQPYLDVLGENVEVMAQRIAGALSNIDSSAITGFIESLSGLSGVIIPLLAVAIGPLMQRLPMIGGLFSKLTGPVGLVISAFILMWKESEVLRDALSNAFSTISEAMGGAENIWSTLSSIILSVAGVLGDSLGHAINFVVPIITWLIDTLNNLLAPSEGAQSSLAGLGGVFDVVIAAVTPLLDVLIGNLIPAIGNVISAVLPLITTIIGSLIPAMTQIISTVVPVVASFVESLMPAIMTVIDVVVSLVGTLVAILIPVWDTIVAAITPLISLILEGLLPVFLDLLTTVVDVFAGLLEAVMPVVETILEALGNFVSFIVETVQPIIETAINAVIGIFEGLATVIEGVVTIISGVIQTFLGVLTGDWSMAWEGIKLIFEGVWTTIQGILETVWAAITGILSVGLSILQALWDTVWNAIKFSFETVWNGIKSFVESILIGISSFIASVLSGISSLWSSIWSGIFSFVSTIWNGINNFITTSINAVRSTMSSVLSSIASTVSSIWSSIFSTISSFMSSISSTISSIWNSIVSAISGFMSSIFSSIQTAWDNVVSTVSTAVSNVYDSVSNTFNNVVSFVADIPSRLLSALGDLSTLFLDAGKSLIGGLTDGIRNAFGGARDAISGGLSTLRNLLPFSPAKEGPFSGRGYTLYSGEALMKDFAKGIEAQERDLQSSLRDVAASAADAFAPALDLPDLAADVASTVQISPPKPPPPPRGPWDGPGEGGGGMTFNIDIGHMTVDSDDRVKQTAQALYDRAERKARARGKVNLGGAVE